MDKFRGIRSFDAFPKTDSQHTVRSRRGGASTLFLVFIILFMAYVEMGDWIDGQINQTFSVDNAHEDVLPINIDIVVAMPCSFIHTNILDVTNDRTLATDYLTFEGRTFVVPEAYLENTANRVIKTPEFDDIMRESLVAEFRQGFDDPNSGAPACHIFGTIPVTKVQGDFHITAKGYGYRDFMARIPVDGLNFSHVINEFSFGDFYPYLDNPLDFTAKVSENHVTSYRYFMPVVPTTYHRLGIEIDTYQYSLTEQEKHFEAYDSFASTPGIHFKYDFEALKLTIDDDRIPFFTFIVRLVTILGGLIICFNWLYRGLDKLLVLAFGKRFASRGSEKPKSLLNDE